VLAGADQVSLIVGTGAIILKLGEGADLDAIGPPGERCHVEGTEDGMSAAILDVGDFLLRPLAPTLDLFLYVNHKPYPPIL